MNSTPIQNPPHKTTATRCVFSIAFAVTYLVPHLVACPSETEDAEKIIRKLAMESSVSIFPNRDSVLHLPSYTLAFESNNRQRIIKGLKEKRKAGFAPEPATAFFLSALEGNVLPEKPDPRIQEALKESLSKNLIQNPYFEFDVAWDFKRTDLPATAVYTSMGLYSRRCVILSAKEGRANSLMQLVKLTNKQSQQKFNFAVKCRSVSEPGSLEIGCKMLGKDMTCGQFLTRTVGKVTQSKGWCNVQYSIDVPAGTEDVVIYAKLAEGDEATGDLILSAVTFSQVVAKED